MPNENRSIISTPENEKEMPTFLSSASKVHTSTSIKLSLKNDRQRFRVESNPSKRATAACWKYFGLPSMSTDENPTSFQILTGFASCKSCFETYKYMDSSTANLNAHSCCQSLSPDQSSITTFIHSPRSVSSSRLISKKKEEVKHILTKWVATSMRSFQIVADPGLKELVQLCLDIGREFRAESRINAGHILPCDRTVKNELERLANEKRNIVKKLLTTAAENRSLSISPDNWTDNHRRISYMGATAHFVDEDLSYQSLDLFCVEFVKEKKSAENIYELLEEQLDQFDLRPFMNTITYVTDRGANFVKSFRSHKVLFCIAHRLNNVLKRCFYQNPTKKSTTSPGKGYYLSTTSVINSDLTPIKTNTVTTTFANGSPEVDEDSYEPIEYESEEDDDSDDECDYTETTIKELPPNVRQILEVIKGCKALVRYVKKTNLNRRLQMAQENEGIDDNNRHEGDCQKKPLGAATTLHQSSVVRWLSLSDLLESIKNAYPKLVVLLSNMGENVRFQSINMDIVDKLIKFLSPWKSVLTELQRTNTPSLFLVLPCITYLRDELASGAKKDRSGVKFFYKRATQLLSSMFTVEDDHIMGAFLHPNYKQLRGVTSSQVNHCHSTCRMFLIPPTSSSPVFISNEEFNEPPSKKHKTFISSLMDNTFKQNQSADDEVDRYINMQIQEDEQYIDPLMFWKQKEKRTNFPNLARLASRYFSIPCSSAAVERQFSAAGQIITQRRSNLDPSTVNNIIFLRSIEKKLNL